VNPRWFASLLVIAIAGGCGKKEEPKPPVSEGVPVSGAPADAQQLGSEMFELIDRIADYRSSHEGRPPKSLRQLGVDSLTASTVRRLAIQGRTFTVTVVYRRPEGRAVQNCSAGEDALEQAALNEGRFAVSCDTPSGPEGFEVVK
jgi:hypothetical protein